MSGAETPDVDDSVDSGGPENELPAEKEPGLVGSSPSSQAANPEVPNLEVDGDEVAGREVDGAVDSTNSVAGSDSGGVQASMSVEELIEATETVTAERDQYLEMLQRSRAEFENYKKRVSSQQSDIVARAAESLVEQLLPVLDAFDGAMAHDADGTEPLFHMFLDALTKQGLERIDDVNETFDPNQHDAVLHEPGDGSNDEPTVIEVMRPGYRWNTRVLRPAMVKVQG